MKSSYTKHLATENEMLVFAASVANVLEDGTIIYLYGPLGAGKTTFTRGILRGLGFEGKVKSPTYTLVEPYEINHRKLFHCDFYRLDHVSEIEHVGIREYIASNAICVIEWAEKGFPLLPDPDLACYIELKGEDREFRMEAHSARGEKILRMIQCAGNQA